MFFVNGRYIRDNTLTAATTKAFKGLIPLGRFGFCILNIEISPKLIDVNVHPTKEEIRFKDEQEAFKAVSTAIHNALSKSELVENIFVPKYDENNFSHFNNYATETEKIDEKSVDKILKQPEENMIKTAKKKGFFNFKERKTDKELEEELEKKHSEIYETLMNNPKFSYEKMLKEKEEQEQLDGEENQLEEDEGERPKFDWIGEEQNTEKISKLKEQIDRTSSLNIHTILNRYKEQVEEDEEEKEQKIREGLREEETEQIEFNEQQEVKSDIQNVAENEYKNIDEEKQKKVLLEQIEEKLEELNKTEDIKDIKEENLEEELNKTEDMQRIVEEKYKKLFDSYRPGDYLKDPEELEEEKLDEKSEENNQNIIIQNEEQNLEAKEIEENILSKEQEITELQETKQEEIQESSVLEENIAKEELSYKQEEQEIKVIKTDIKENVNEEKKDLLKQISEKLEEKSVLSDEQKNILDQIRVVLEKDSITKTPELKSLAQDDDEEHKDHFSEEFREAAKTNIEDFEETLGFQTVQDESFVKQEKNDEEGAKGKLSNLLKSSKEETAVEAQNIVGNLIAQKIEKGEITSVLDLDAINKILEQELQEKQELEKLEKKESGSRFEFAKMYKRAFGVDSYETQQEKKAFEESINMSASFTAPELTFFNDIDIPPYSVIGVIFGTYIIIEMRDSIYIIDQHATHEKLLYEEVKFNYYNDQYKDSQTLLLPDVITLSYREMELVRKNVGIFKKTGFELEEFGINTIKLVAVPSMTEILNTKELFLDILDEIDNAYVTGKDEIEERFLSTIACKAAVKANMALDEKEIRALLDDLLRLHNPFTCPHGRPTAIKMKKSDLERKFARK